MKFNTKTIHAGVHPDPSTGAIMTPIFQTSTYVQNAPGDHKGYEYARTQNPTRQVLEANVAALEEGKYGIAFGSGLAALDAIMKLLEAGDEVIATNDLYGGSYRLMTAIYGKLGIKSTFVDLTDPEVLKEHLNEKTKLVWLETPTNPLLRILDIRRLVDIAHEAGVMVCVDNTFASPYLQQPLTLGSDLVLHSATKYLGGHSDVVLGIVATSSEALAERLYYIQNASGGVPGPQDCFLVIRGIKTLHVRMQRACENAAKIVSFLQEHPKVDRIIYPGLPSHPNHDIAKRQMKDFGAMVSFDLKGEDPEAGLRVLQNTKLFALAESLGGVESLISLPAAMTHASIPREDRLASGLTDTLIRMSVGIEDVEDLIADLKQALSH